jgi:hypothetical protein
VIKAGERQLGHLGQVSVNPSITQLKQVSGLIGLSFFVPLIMILPTRAETAAEARVSRLTKRNGGKLDARYWLELGGV